MSTHPSSDPGDDANRRQWEEMLRQLGFGGDGTAPDLNSILAALQGQMASFQRSYGTVNAGEGANWSVRKDAARKTAAAAGPDPTPDDAAVRRVRDSAELADSWLADATAFSPLPSPAKAWSRAEWIEASMPTWQQLVGPVVTSIANALGGLLHGGALGDPNPEAAQFEQMFAPMLRQAAAAMFGAQAGQSIGQLATAVVSASDLGLPMTGGGQAALLPTNVEAFREGLEIAENDVWMYLALRETARQRLFASVPWLSSQLLALVEHYAREIRIDENAISAALGDLDDLDPERLQQVAQRVNGSLFEPAMTPEQQEVLGRLETLVALVEGWVDDVVAEAAAQWLPSLDALTEAMRRRRAAGGPTEAALKALVGLELRPRRVRDASHLWAAVRSDRGIAGRDDIWAHPDLLPSERDLDDPLGYVSGETRAAADDDLDAELARLLDGDEPPAPDDPGEES